MARAYIKKKGNMAREGKSKGRIITPKATRDITILFYQKLNGAWTTLTEYPRSEPKLYMLAIGLNILNINNQMRK